MLSKLFRSTPKWQSIKSQKRIEAIQELQPAQEKDIEILTQLAREDSEPAVRREAVLKLYDFDILMQIQKRDLEAPVREAAGARLHELMAGKSPFSPSVEDRLQRLDRINSPQVLAALIQEAEPVEIRLAAIAALHDEMYLQDIALHSNVARLRQAAAERLITPALLEELANASKQKDKSVYRIVKGRLDAIHDKEKQDKAQQLRAIALCESMEAHARSALNPLYAAKTESLRQQWSELASADSLAVAERFTTAHSLACQQIEDVLAAEQRAANEAQARHELQGALETLESTVKEYVGQEDFDLPALLAVRKTQRLRWELASQLHAPTVELSQRYDSATQSLDSLEALLGQWGSDQPAITLMLQAVQEENATTAVAHEPLMQMLTHYRQTGWPLPALLQQAALALGEKTPSPPTKAKDEAAKEQRQTLQKQLDDVESSIRDGNSREASSRWRKVVDFARQHHLHHPRMQTLGEQVRELKSWAGFVVQPKKEALLVAMQTLVGHAGDPDDIADRIRALQDEWKSLGVADPASEQPLWEQFKAASDAAYEPCRLHFSEQRELRIKNLNERIALCEQLEQYRDAITDTIDWKNHDAILRTARQEWQQHQPVDRHASRKVQDRFNGIMKTLDAQREAHWSQIANGKQALIDKARQLLVSDDLRVACDQAKLLQQEWKLIGVGSSRNDGRQWKEFRAACDAVFNRREAAFKERKEAHQNVLQQAEHIVQSMERLATGAIESQCAELSTLEETLRALDLGRDGHALRERAQKAVKQFELACAEQKHQQQLGHIKAGIDAWLAVCQAEQALIDGALPLQPDISALPARWKTPLLERQQATVTTTETAESLTAWQAAIPGNTQLVLDALLDLELTLDVPSPAARGDERRNRQLFLLQQKGLRAGSASNNTQSFQRILATGPISPAVAAEIAQRLQAIALKIQ